ncbi:hypothetical protein ABTA72_19625, partial [Acinetobacter baumannii]
LKSSFLKDPAVQSAGKTEETKSILFTKTQLVQLRDAIKGGGCLDKAEKLAIKLVAYDSTETIMNHNGVSIKPNYQLGFIFKLRDSLGND